MRKYVYDNTELFISCDKARESNLDEIPDCYKYIIQNTLDNFVRKNPNYFNFLKLFSTIQCLDGYAILDAHGYGRDYNWYYIDGQKNLLVQNWINKMDGKHAALILTCCNEASCEIYSKKSIIFVPNYIYSELRQDIGDGQIEMYVPGKGYIDSYTIEYEIKEMEREHRNI